MTKLKAMIIPFLAGGLLAACETLDDPERDPIFSARADYQGIPVERRGKYEHFDREFQNRAIRDALNYLEAQGIAQARVTQVTVAPRSRTGIAEFRPVTFGSNRTGAVAGVTVPRLSPFALLVFVSGCEEPLLFRTNRIGRFETPDAPVGCPAGP